MFVNKCAATAWLLLGATCLAPFAAFGPCAAGTGEGPEVPVGIRTVAHGHGWIFTDPDGRSLYTTERDARKPGGSTCNDQCAKTWPPHLAPADAAPRGDWSLVKRDDGTVQWAYAGNPLYTYALDPASAVSFGDGFAQVWHLAMERIPLPKEITLTETLLGQTAADSHGLTLYALRPKDLCMDACLKKWRPLEAPGLAHAIGDWPPVDRVDGLRQWTFKGRPLFLFSDDIVPHETNGEGYDGLWQAVVLEPSPPLPQWVHVEGSDAGHLYADARGMTIYTHVPRPGGCVFGDCISNEWRPVIAPPEFDSAGASGKEIDPTDVKAGINRGTPSGYWSIFARPDGVRQWAYKGQLIFTNSNDRHAGDFRGVRYGGDRTFAALMVSGEIMAGVRGDSAAFLQ